MANRHLSRSVVLQSLFEWDFLNKDHKATEVILLRNSEEFAPGVGDIPFMKELLSGVLQKQSDLDKVIEKAAPEWPIDKISIIDRNILRLGLFELLFSDRKEVPAKVAINEAIELAKTFGGEKSGKFVNGVLGAVYKEMGEPGKSDHSTKKVKEVPFEKMAIEKKVGAVVYTKRENDLMFALIHDVFGHWTLSKGGLEEGEDAHSGVTRVIKEEMGLNVTRVIDELGNTEYVANHPDKGKHRKQVLYFLVEADFTDIKLGESGGIDDGKWFKAQDILELNFYNDIVPLITKSLQLITSKNQQ